MTQYVPWWWPMMKTNKYDLTPILVAIFVPIGVAVLWYRSTLSRCLPPGPRNLPIVGYLPFLDPNLHTHFTNMAHSHGPIFKIWLGIKLYVVINTPELAKTVVRDQDETFANRSLTIAASIIAYGGQDIAWSNSNSSWRNLRKILVHEVLSNKNLEACSSFRTDEVRKMIKNVYSKIGTRIDVKEISFFMIANVLTTMVWGKDNHLGAELQMVVSKIVEMLGRPNLSDFFPFLTWFDLQGVERESKVHFKELDRVFTSIIDDRIKLNSERLDVGVGHEGKKDFLQILLELKDQKDATSLDITKIKALLTDIMVAGTETTTSVIEWAMTEIMQNRHVMKRVQEGLAEVVGPNNIVEESHLSKLKYLDATVKETLRLHPVVPLLVPRSPSQTCTVGGYTIPKGSTVFVNVWAIHRDPRNWDNPLEFDPERFLTEEGMDKYDFKGNNLKFFPFGSGRRLCPGVPLAEKMGMYILASFLHSFDWSLPKGEEHDFSDTFSIALKKRKPLVAIPSQRLRDSPWWQVMSTHNHNLTPVLAAIFVLIGAAVLWYRSTLSSSLPPGPRHLPILGYLPFLDPNLHTHFTNMARSYGPIFKIWLGSKLYVVINTQELAKVVVRDQDETFANRSPTIAALAMSYGGQGIGWSNNNSSLRNLRKILVHQVLSNKNLEESGSIRRDEVRKMIRNVYSKMGAKIDINEISFSMISNILTTMAWGKDNHFGVELQIVISKIVEMIGRPNLSDFFPFLKWFDLQGVERETKMHSKNLDRLLSNIINDRIKSNSESLDVAARHEGKRDLLQFLLELKDQKDTTSLDIDKIKALLTDTMIAGTETTTSLTQWAMAEIMHNRNIMKRVQEELADIVGTSNIVEESHLPKLKYLDATIKETLRLHPGVPLLIPRSPSQTCTVGEYTIPKGSTVFVNVWAIHRDPRNWDNPLEFNPERFLTREGMDKYDFKGNNLKFLPFGSGRRACPGVPLATKVQTYILASLLHSFEWSLPEGEEHDFSDVFSIALKKRKPLVAVPSQRLSDVSLYM
ncbi:cytochrome P450 [Cynara cardunculus var. scolymus]|uniref:Cytochrome P450 n=1 Tax=Cynara cardunculus var. scolymus TaxID=59895 RepID=A0A124SHC6_CYNCS|nr:cytochrome P450 [Cynara cardunculus var. scolymus]